MNVAGFGGTIAHGQGQSLVPLQIDLYDLSVSFKLEVQSLFWISKIASGVPHGMVIGTNNRPKRLGIWARVRRMIHTKHSKTDWFEPGMFFPCSFRFCTLTAKLTSNFTSIFGINPTLPEMNSMQQIWMLGRTNHFPFEFMNMVYIYMLYYIMLYIIHK